MARLSQWTAYEYKKRKGVKDDSKVSHLSNEKNGDATKGRWKRFWHGEDQVFCITHVESEMYIRHPSVDGLLLVLKKFETVLILITQNTTTI